MNSPETVNTPAPQLHPSPIGARALHLQNSFNSSAKTLQRSLGSHGSNSLCWQPVTPPKLPNSCDLREIDFPSIQRRRELSHECLHFHPCLVELSKLTSRTAKCAAIDSVWCVECAAPGRSSQYGTRGFPGLTANPQHTFGPSWSVRLLVAPRSMGPAVFLGSPPNLNTHLVPPGVCGSWSLLAVWDPRFSWAHRQPSTHINLPQHIAKDIRDTMSLTKMPTQPQSTPRPSRDKAHHHHPTTAKELRDVTTAFTAPHQQTALINSEQLLPCR